MENYQAKDNLNFTYTVHAVIFGADESLLKVNLIDGFSFKRMSLNTNVDTLDKIFDTNSTGLRRDYESAKINCENLEVVCVVKEETIFGSVKSISDMFYKKVDDDLASLDNQIRIIRFLKECPLRFKKIAFHMNSEKFELFDGVSSSASLNDILPIGESINTQPISTFHCSDDEAETINRSLIDISLPLQDELLNLCHRYYDLSYHTEKFISITLLITALEILFLSNDKGQKKEMLAKRCATYISGSDEYIKENYDNLKTMYKKRSQFVHNGNCYGVDDEDILYLRKCVRESMQKALSTNDSKNQRIERIKAFVKDNIVLFGDKNEV